MNIKDIRKEAPRHRTKRPTFRAISGIRQIVLHHGMTRRWLAGTNYEAYCRYHTQTNNWSVGGYTYGVEPDGAIKWGYDWNIQTPHVGNSNRHSLGIVLPGDFRFEEPTTIQYQRALELVNWLLPQLPNCNKVIGHQEVLGYSWKDCPAFSMDQFRTDLQRVQQGETLDEEEVYFNMKLTQVELGAVISALENWTDGNRHRNPLSKSWLGKARKGELTIRESVRLQYEADRRGLR